MDRKGSRAMMQAEESTVKMSPVPPPICCWSDLAIPSLAAFGERVLSTNWAWLVATEHTNAVRAMALHGFVRVAFIVSLASRRAGGGIFQTKAENSLRSFLAKIVR